MSEGGGSRCRISFIEGTMAPDFGTVLNFSTVPESTAVPDSRFANGSEAGPRTQFLLLTSIFGMFFNCEIFRRPAGFQCDLPHVGLFRSDCYALNSIAKCRPHLQVCSGQQDLVRQR
jgi:hypothetical protein